MTKDVVPSSSYLNLQLLRREQTRTINKSKRETLRKVDFEPPGSLILLNLACTMGRSEKQ